jgi:hypothetical protein
MLWSCVTIIIYRLHSMMFQTLIFYSISEINVWLVYLFNFKHFFIPFEALFYFQASECICFDNVTVSKLSQNKVCSNIRCPGNQFDRCGKTGTNEYVLYEKSIIFIHFYYTWHYQERRVGLWSCVTIIIYRLHSMMFH